jgi:predicted nucleotidyltransferase
MEKIVSALKEFLSRQWRGSELRMAYLFGSTATGHGWKTLQDIDVAVVFAAGYSLEDGERLSEELGRLFERKVDVVVLNEAPAALWYEVLCTGRLILSADESERVEREVRSLMQYYDLEPQRERLANDIRRMIREGAF